MLMAASMFVGDLSYFCTDQDLYNLFSKVGRVRSAIVRRSRNNDTLHYGFVQMETMEEAHRAVAEMSGFRFMGRKLRVNIGNESTQSSTPKADIYQMHVSFISHKMEERIDEEHIDRIFSQFGTVLDCIIKQYSVTWDPIKQCGYGFVFFDSQQAVEDAVHASNYSLLAEIHFDCKMSHHTKVEPRADKSSITRCLSSISSLSGSFTSSQPSGSSAVPSISIKSADDSNQATPPPTNASPERPPSQRTVQPLFRTMPSNSKHQQQTIYPPAGYADLPSTTYSSQSYPVLAVPSNSLGYRPTFPMSFPGPPPPGIPPYPSTGSGIQHEHQHPHSQSHPLGSYGHHLHGHPHGTSTAVPHDYREHANLNHHGPPPAHRPPHGHHHGHQHEHHPHPHRHPHPPHPPHALYAPPTNSGYLTPRPSTPLLSTSGSMPTNPSAPISSPFATALPQPEYFQDNNPLQQPPRPPMESMPYYYATNQLSYVSPMFIQQPQLPPPQPAQTLPTLVGYPHPQQHPPQASYIYYPQAPAPTPYQNHAQHQNQYQNQNRQHAHHQNQHHNQSQNHQHGQHRNQQVDSRPADGL